MGYYRIPGGLVGVWIVIWIFWIAGCAAGRPATPESICGIFRERPRWYEDVSLAGRRWGVPVPVIMAILYQESAFDAKARPPRTTCLWIFPGPRPSSAYGYAQALDETWALYRLKTGNRGADRNDFGDAVDFVGWYCHQTRRLCGIRENDAYNQYLAYYEGQGGFNRGTWREKAWLKQAASRVRDRAAQYTRQLATCEREFQSVKGRGCCLWPF